MKNSNSDKSTHSSSKDAKSREMLFEQLEERVLFDAVPTDLSELTPEDGADADSANGNAARFDTSVYAEDVKVISDESLLPKGSTPDAESVSKELVLVDTNVEEYEKLVADLLGEEDPLRDFEIVTFNSNEDGIAQISSLLSNYSDIDALHLVTHGDELGVNLGNVWLTQENLGGYASEIAQWGNAFSENGDILFYGCDLGATADGRDLLQSFQILTGTDVAASVDKTGHASRGGDWDLEYILGSMETSVAFSDQVQQDWRQILAPGPKVDLAVVGGNDVPLGEDVTLQLTFTNNAPSGQVGYGPYVDLLIPKLGADGEYDGGVYNESADGLTVAPTGAVTYFGQAVNYEVLTFPDSDGVGGLGIGVIEHPYAMSIQNETQLLGLSGDVDGGTFTIEFDGEVTGPIDYNAGPAAIQTALEGLAGIGAGNVQVNGTALQNGVLEIEFIGALAQMDIDELIVDVSDLTVGGVAGGSASVTTLVDGDSVAQAQKMFGNAGDQLVVMELPFGSFTPEQPAAVIHVQASMSSDADLNHGLTVRARSGFRFGADELNNPGADPSVVSDPTSKVNDWSESETVTPTLLKIAKWNDVPEEETATGPNYIRTWSIRVDIPEGQTIKNLDIFDDLPDNIVFVSLDSITTSVDTGTVFTTNLPSGNNSVGTSVNNTAHTGTNSHPTLDVSGVHSNQSFVVTADQVTGAASETDVVVTFKYYVAEFDANGDRVILESGEDDTTASPDSRVKNTARAIGDWSPTDTRDQNPVSEMDNAVADPAGFEDIVDAKSITTHKSVQVVNAAGAPTGEQYITPGSILKYTINFQISDYYTFGDIEFKDIFSDGQWFYDTLDPTFTVKDANGSLVNEQFDVYVGPQGASATPLGTDHFIVDQSEIDISDNVSEDPSTDGTTKLTIKLSEAMIARGAADGILQGGLSHDGDSNEYANKNVAATGTIVFYTQVQDQFTDDFPGGDRSVDQGDYVENTVTVTGNSLENIEDDDNGTLHEILTSESDSSGTSIRVDSGVLRKTIHAINGDTNFDSSVEIAPGDEVTYRLTYTLPTSDFENLIITDFFPLPVFEVGDANADGGPSTNWTFDPDQSVDQMLPGVVELMKVNGTSGDTFYEIWDLEDNGVLDNSVEPTFTFDESANSLKINFGDFDNPGFQRSQIDMLLTVAVQDAVFADGLFLTNQVLGEEFNSDGTQTSQIDLVQVTLTQPVVAQIQKGIVDTNKTTAFNAADGANDVAFSEVGSVADFTSGTISSDWLENTDFEKLVEDLDAGDTARFVVVVENVGSSRKGAYDVTIADTLGAGLSYVGGSLRVYDGAGDAMLYDGAETDLFGAGLRISDPGATPEGFDGVNAGALDEFDETSGRNIAVLVYDVTIDHTAQPLQELENSVTLTHFAGQEGGANYAVSPEPDSAAVTIQNVSATKSIVATSEAHTEFENGAERVAVGEIVRYHIAVEIPEGTLPHLSILDKLPTGLTFIDDGTAKMAFVSDNGITSTTLDDVTFNLAGSDGTITPVGVLPDDAISREEDPGNELDNWANGRDPYFKLGEVVNTDSDANAEYVIIEFNALVNNSIAGSNDSNDNRHNDLEVYLDLDGNGNIEGDEEVFDLPQGQRPMIDVVEPVLTGLTKSAAIAPTDDTDGGTLVTYTINFSVSDAVRRSDAFDVRLEDNLPSDLTLNTGSLDIRVNTVAIDPTNLTDNSDADSIDFIIGRLNEGDTVSVTYTATIDQTVSPEDIVLNRANLTWTSLPGAFGTANGTNGNDTGSDLASIDDLSTHGNSNPEYNSKSGESEGERNGSGTDVTQPNDYYLTSTATVTVDTIGITKTLDGSSIVDTAGSGNNGDKQAVIGELLYYTVTGTLPDSTIEQAQIFDQLDAGLEFVEITNITGGVGITAATGALNNSSIAAYETAMQVNGTGDAGDAQSLVFNFGDITNTDEGLGQDNTVSISYVVRVKNIAANQSTVNESGPALNNVARFQWDVTGDDVADRHSLNASAEAASMIEPILDVTKTVVAPHQDASDPVEYTITIKHDGGSGEGSGSETDAYDLTFLDQVPASINVTGFTVNHTSPFTVDPLIASKFQQTGNAIETIPGQTFDLLVGEEVTIVITGTVVSTTGAGLEISNTATVDWTSQDGTVTGERTGADGEAGALNDYATSGSVEFDIDRPTLKKELVSTSVVSTNNTNTEAVIGETAIYKLTLTVPEGEMDSAKIIDTMDLGLDFIQIESVSAPWMAMAPTVTPTTSGDGITTAQTLTLDLGDLSNPLNNAAAEEIVITYSVRVTNSTSVGNDSGEDSQLTNSAEIQWDLGGTQGVQSEDAPTSPTISVIEPDLDIVKNVVVDGSGSAGDAGDTVKYTIDISHASTSTDAFDVIFTDLVPAEILYGIGDVTVTHTDTSSTDTDITHLFSVLPNGTLTTNAGTTFDVLEGETVQIVINGALSGAVTPNESIHNAATIKWTSLNDGELSGGTSSERDGEGTGADDYAETSSNGSGNNATITIDGAEFNKSLFGTNETETTGAEVAIGEVVTYALRVELPEGSTPGLTVVDILPSGLKYVSSRIITTAADSQTLLANDFNGTLNAPTVTGGANDGDDVTFSFGAITVANDHVASTEAFLILVEAVVVDTPTNVGYGTNQDTLVNTATMDVTGDGVAAQSGGNVSVLVVESNLSMTKEFGPIVDVDAADAAESVTVNLVVDNTTGEHAAYGVTVKDTLNPAHYDLTTMNFGASGTNYPADFTVSFNSTTGELEYTGGTIAEGATETFSFTIALRDDVLPGSTLLNTATITEASSLEGDVAGERDDNGHSDNDSMYIRRNSLAGFVWDDLDNDGIKDLGESGIEDVKVRLVGTDHLGNAVSIDVDTNASGAYIFDNLRPGTYSIIEDPNSDTIAATLLDGKDTIGTPGGNDSTNDQFSNISLPTGKETHGTNNNFGEIRVSSLTGYVYHDADNDGTRDGTESGIDDITVHLQGVNDLGQNVSILTTTAGGGKYTFNKLRPSNGAGYSITQITEPVGHLDGKDTDGSLDNGDATTTNNKIDSINIVPGDTGTEYNFGEVKPSKLSGYVYHDSNNNGLQSDDGVTNGIDNITLTLVGKDDLGNDVLKTTTTNSSGYYEFDNLRPSDATGYSIEQRTQPAGHLDGKDTIGTPGGTSTNDDHNSIIVVSNTNGQNNNFGELLASSLSGRVFVDHDNDGVYEAGDGETGIKDVAITLTGKDDLGADVDVTVYTNAQGEYSFTGLRPSDASGYTITETHPTAYTDGLDVEGSINGTGPVGDAPNGALPNNDLIQSIVVTSDDTGTGFDFAEQGTSISGTVFVDDDRDGTLEGGEVTRIGGVTIELFDMTDPLNPVLLDSVLTASNGTYSFDHLPAGDYRLVQTQLTQYGNTSPNTVDITVPLAGLTGNDFGEALYDIGDTVYFDANNSGSQDAGEPGLDDVGVSLQYAGVDGIFGNDDDPVEQTTTTNANGFYEFKELFKGNYRVVVTGGTPTGAIVTDDQDDTGVAELDGTSHITINNADRFDADFGYRGTGSIGDSVFYDVDASHSLTAGDLGLPGIDVTLSVDLNGDGTTDYTVTTTTDINGVYKFENLLPGTYTVSVDSTDLPPGMADNPTYDSNGVATPHTTEVVLAADEVNKTTDFGYTGNSSIGDLVWLDTDSSGVQNGTNEPGLANVTVTLTWAGANGTFDGTGPASDDEVFTVDTDATGKYLFKNLPGGLYRVDVDGTDVAANTSLTTANDPVDINLPAKTENLTADFGFVGKGSIGDHVFFDHNGNGLEDGDDTGWGGITITITGDIDGDGVDEVFTTTTDSDGDYSVSGLPHGDYVVTATPPSGSSPTYDANGIATPNVSEVTLDAEDPSSTKQDFGFTGTGTVGDVVFFDEDGDGIQDGSEVGIPDVDVTIEVDLDGDGTPDFSTTIKTGSDGTYSFKNIPAGEVTVTVTPPGGSAPTTDFDGMSGGDSENTFDLDPGETNNKSDFGFLGNGSIGDTVFFDADGDGIQDDGTGADPSEPGLANVTVELDIDFDGNGTVDRTLSTTTDSSGNYAFTNLPVGDYTVRVTQPTGTSPTSDSDGVGAGSENQSKLTLGKGEKNTVQDFGYKGTGSIRDTVFFDIDNDGSLDPNPTDRGLPGVDVTLEIDLNGDGNSDYTTTVTTNSDGEFTFANLIPGTYTITTDSDDMPEGLANNPTVDNDGTMTPHEATYTVKTGAETTGTGFGFHATPDYEITKTGEFTNASPGELLKYTITVKNIGELDGRNVVITDSFPTSVLSIVDADGGTVDTDDGTITWELASMDPDEELVLIVQARVLDPIAAGIDEFTNSVTVDDDHDNGDDPDTKNNKSSKTATLDAQPDYEITKTNGVDTLSPGDQTTYTITITNNGNQNGTGVVVTDTYPKEILALVDAAGGDVDTNAGTITWKVGDLDVDETVVFKVTFDVINPALVGVDDLDNIAEIEDDGTNGTDPTPEDNKDTDTDTLNAVPDYRITKSIVGNPEFVEPGDTIRYSIVVENIGSQNGTGVIVTDTYPTHLLTDISSTGATIDHVNGTIEWKLGELEGGETVVLTVTAKLSDTVQSGEEKLINEVFVTDDLSNGTDPTPDNNEDDDNTTIFAAPDFKIVKSDGGVENIEPNTTVVYTIVYSNIGNQDATGIVITEYLPDGSTFNAEESDPRWVDNNDGTFTIELAELDAGDSGSIAFAVTTDEVRDPNREELVNTVTIHDDGTNGPDTNEDNNTGVDNTPLQVYSFDSFNTFMPSDGLNNQDGELDNKLKPLPIHTVYTGMVDPGTTLTGKIYDSEGHLVGEQVVVADSAGNWLMQFPTVVLFEHPHEMRLSQTLAVQNSSTDSGFNVRRFFHPAVHTQVFMVEELSIGAAFRHNPFDVLQSMHEANNNPLGFGWNHHAYELVISSSNTSSR